MSRVEEFMNTEGPDGKTVSFGLDSDGRLYINGERVVTEQKVKLAWWINFAAVLGGLGAFVQGLAAILGLYK